MMLLVLQAFSAPPAVPHAQSIDSEVMLAANRDTQPSATSLAWYLDKSRTDEMPNATVGTLQTLQEANQSMIGAPQVQLLEKGLKPEPQTECLILLRANQYCMAQRNATSMQSICLVLSKSMTIACMRLDALLHTAAHCLFAS